MAKVPETEMTRAAMTAAVLAEFPRAIPELIDPICLRSFRGKPVEWAAHVVLAETDSFVSVYYENGMWRCGYAGASCVTLSAARLSGISGYDKKIQSCEGGKYVLIKAAEPLKEPT